jgi:hypothetical protein
MLTIKKKFPWQIGNARRRRQAADRGETSG